MLEEAGVGDLSHNFGNFLPACLLNKLNTFSRYSIIRKLRKLKTSLVFKRVKLKKKYFIKVKGIQFKMGN